MFDHRSEPGHLPCASGLAQHPKSCRTQRAHRSPTRAGRRSAPQPPDVRAAHLDLRTLRVVRATCQRTPEPLRMGAERPRVGRGMPLAQTWASMRSPMASRARVYCTARVAGRRFARRRRASCAARLKSSWLRTAPVRLGHAKTQSCSWRATPTGRPAPAEHQECARSCRLNPHAAARSPARRHWPRGSRSSTPARAASDPAATGATLSLPEPHRADKLVVVDARREVNKRIISPEMPSVPNPWEDQD
jgi:hypothetical protein